MAARSTVGLEVLSVEPGGRPRADQRVEAAQREEPEQGPGGPEAERRVRDARPREGIRGHLFPGDQRFLRSTSGRTCPAVPTCAYPFCTNCWFERPAAVSVSRSVNVAAREVCLTKRLDKSLVGARPNDGESTGVLVRLATAYFDPLTRRRAVDLITSWTNRDLGRTRGGGRFKPRASPSREQEPCLGRPLAL
jgi:hypothetical protein